MKQTPIEAATAILSSEPIQTVARALKHMPPVRALVGSRRWQSLRHRLILEVGKRDDKTFTRFARVATQFEALTGPVLTFVNEHRDRTQPLRIMVLGCSNGAEAYSIASVLSGRFPDVPFAVAAYDLKNDLVEQGRRARYSETEVIGSMAPDGFVEETFVRCADGFIVQPQIAHRVQFDIADVMDERLRERVGAADIVFAQNLMINFRRGAARKAFHNICDVLESRAALFVDGMDVDLRARLTRDRGLVPLDFKIREIHEDARKIRGAAWPWIYWGLEPFMDRPDAKRRYATVFLKG